MNQIKYDRCKHAAVIFPTLPLKTCNQLPACTHVKKCALLQTAKHGSIWHQPWFWFSKTSKTFFYPPTCRKLKDHLQQLPALTIYGSSLADHCWPQTVTKCHNSKEHLATDATSRPSSAAVPFCSPSKARIGWLRTSFYLHRLRLPHSAQRLSTAVYTQHE